jgi:predicted ATPase
MPARYVLTGAPGAGKTVLLHALAAAGHAVVHEAATDVIAEMQAWGVNEPWEREDFCDCVVAVQRHRQTAQVPSGVALQIYDRSPLCTLALSRYLGRPPSPALCDEVARALADRAYEPIVFLVRPLGFIERTAGRRISYADSLVFEALHQAVYDQHGFTLVDVPAAPVAERAQLVGAAIDRRAQRAEASMRDAHDPL